jgi:hypothetical protein
LAKLGVDIGIIEAFPTQQSTYFAGNCAGFILLKDAELISCCIFSAWFFLRHFRIRQ